VKKQKNKSVATLKLVDYSSIKIPMIVVYSSPTDFPGKVIGRVFEGANATPTDIYCEYKTVEQCRADALTAGFDTVISRCQSDEIHIVESYI